MSRLWRALTHHRRPAAPGRLDQARTVAQEAVRAFVLSEDTKLRLAFIDEQIAIIRRRWGGDDAGDIQR